MRSDQKSTRSEIYKIKDLVELKNFTAKLREVLTDKSILLLQGELGAGKTKTIEFLLKEMNYNQTSSPTFALHQQYILKNDFTVDHFDLYRIESEDELEGIGFWDVFAKAKGWVVIEWANRLRVEDLPKDWQIIKLDISLRDQARVINLEY